jgi:1-deoxyxylulose-5-phosphate synthase
MRRSTESPPDRKPITVYGTGATPKCRQGGRVVIDQRPLGASGYRISAIGLGTVNIGRRLDEAASFRLMDHALERGITFFDTAEEYAAGLSERIIGNWLRRSGCRRLITLCTKVLQSAGDIHRGLEASLARLGTDHVEIYLMHEFVPSPPLDEILAALTEEAHAGRVRTIGCSDYTTAQLEQALQISRSRNYRLYEVLQPEYNLVMAPVGVDSMFPVGLSEFEDQLFPLCERNGIAVTTYSPLGAGMLTGKYTRDRPLLPDARFDRMTPSAAHFLTERNFKILDLLRTKAETLGIPIVRLALAWTMTHPSVTSVIIGPRTTEQIDEAIAAYEMALSSDLRTQMAAWTRAV